MVTATAAPLTLEACAAQLVLDPLAFVYFAYPWGVPGTPLADHAGPDTWQIAVLNHLRTRLTAPEQTGFIGTAVASGHGIGKGALTAWLVHWFLATRPHPQVVVTANTQVQLTTKTWREVAKWHQLSRFRDWFTWTATRYYLTQAPDTWFAAAIPWVEHKPEAFQGTHEQYVMMLYDEASAIPDTIYEASEGSMTTPGAIWCLFGNPTRPTGRFRQCFPGGRLAHRWQTFQIDSRTCRLANQPQLAQWITDYGEDSDFVRVRVQGVFPRQAVGQFIGDALIALAQSRQPVEDVLQPHLMGVDVARYGDDKSVILIRHGGNLVLKRIFREIDTVRLAGYVCETIDHYPQPLVVFIDGVGIGAGVIDQCRARGYAVTEVQAGAKAQDERHFVNKRAEMWQRLKEWLERRGRLTRDDTDLIADLTGPEYDYDTGKLRLEKKEDMKARGLASPDEGDALALTFAEPVALQFGRRREALVASGLDFDPRGSL